METFSALLAICAGNSPVTGEIPAQRPVTRGFDVFFDLRLNEGGVNNREAGDLRRHHAHYDVTIMIRCKSQESCAWFTLYCVSMRVCNPGWGLLSQFPPFRHFLKFSALSEHTLAIEYHVYI